VVQPDEQCDDGNDNPFDGCDGCILVDITPD
jgi:cysteine-rich repeat protein